MPFAYRVLQASLLVSTFRLTPTISLRGTPDFYRQACKGTGFRNVYVYLFICPNRRVAWSRGTVLHSIFNRLPPEWMHE